LEHQGARVVNFDKTSQTSFEINIPFAQEAGRSVLPRVFDVYLEDSISQERDVRDQIAAKHPRIPEVEIRTHRRAGDCVEQRFHFVAGDNRAASNDLERNAHTGGFGSRCTCPDFLRPSLDGLLF